jgi:hypothetical protein
MPKLKRPEYQAFPAAAAIGFARMRKSRHNEAQSPVRSEKKKKTVTATVL